MGEHNSELTGKVALITGASRGLGHALSLALAEAGAHIIAIARRRSVGALEALDDAIAAATGRRATLVPLELTDGQGIDNLGAALFERFGKLDILVSNAGILGPISPVGHIAPKDWDRGLAVNLTAHYRLIRSMDPLLRRAAPSRAVFIGCSTAQTGANGALPFWSGYGAAKAGLAALVAAYGAESANLGIAVTLVDPGPMATGLRAKAFPGEAAGAQPAAGDKAKAIVALLSQADPPRALSLQPSAVAPR